MEKFINNKIQELNEINSSRENKILPCSYLSCGRGMRGFYFNNVIPLEDTETFIRVCNKMNLNRCPKHIRSDDEKNDLRILYLSQ
jgi:hypothetical protein